FPYVFLVGMEEGIFPHQRSIGSDQALEEERRLAYVGITRAEKQLYLLYTKMRKIFGQTSLNPPSRFLEELPDHLLSKMGTTPSVKQRRPLPMHTGGSEQEWAPGDRVEHRKWGVGTVVKVQGSGKEAELNIAFPSPIGVKKLLACYAPIEKVDSTN